MSVLCDRAALREWHQKLRARRCAPAPFTYTEHFSRYTPSNQQHFRMQVPISLAVLLRVPDLWAHAERSGSEGCYVEVARWSELRQRWERFAFAKVFGGEIKEQPDLGDNETAILLANFINERMKNTVITIVHNFPSFNEPLVP